MDEQSETINPYEEVERLAIGMSHDLREPIRTISTYLGLLKREHGDKLDKEALEYLETVLEGGRRINGMVDSLSLYAKSHTQEAQFERVSLDHVLSEVIQSIQKQIEKAGAHIDVVSLPDVYGDPALLLPLFQKVILHRLRAHEKLRMKISSRSDKEMISIFFIDDGPSDYPREIEIFRHLEAREKFPWDTIDLASARHIAERHGGTLTSPSRGNLVITLPGVAHFS